MKKKALVALAISALVLTGCGGAKESASTSETAAEGQAQASTAEETKTETHAEEADWWRQYTDAAPTNSTDLNFMGLGLAQPLSWSDIIPHIQEMDISGRAADEVMGDNLAPEEMLTTDKVLSGAVFNVTVNGAKLDFSLGLPSEEEKNTPIGECVQNGRFILNTRDGDVAQFLGIPDGSYTIEENSQEEYSLFEAIVQTYGKPDYIGKWEADVTSFFWKRNGYYFGVESQCMPNIEYMMLSYATYVPESAWDFYANVDTVNRGFTPLVPYDEVV